MPDAFEIHRSLFGHRPTQHRNLLKNLLLPGPEREPRLAAAARWYGLADALLRLGEGAVPDVSETERWLRLLELISEPVPFAAYDPAQPHRVGLPERDRWVVASIASTIRRHVAAEQARGYGLDPFAEDDFLLVDPPTLASDALFQEVAASLKDRHGWTIDAELLERQVWVEMRRRLSSELAWASTDPQYPHVLPRYERLSRSFTRAHFDALHSKLLYAQPAFVVIRGRAGSGKSELALTYAVDAISHHRYAHVFWLPAHSPSRLEQAWDELAWTLREDGDEWPKTNADRIALRRKAFGVLEKTNDWLLIFDNVAQPAALQQWMPRGGGGHILAAEAGALGGDDPSDGWETYFRLDIRGPASQHRFDVPPLRREGLELMLDYPPKRDEDAQRSVRWPTPESIAAETDELALVLGLGPEPLADDGDGEAEGAPDDASGGAPRLAAMLAVRHIKRHGTPSVASFAEAYRRAASETVDADDHAFELGFAQEATPGTIAALVLLEQALEDRSLKNGELLGEHAVDVLTYLQFYDSGPVPASVLTAEPFVEGQHPINDARLAYLDDLGLASVHYLLQASPTFEVHQEARAAVARWSKSRRELARYRASAGQTARHELARIPREGETEREDDPRLIELDALPHLERMADVLAVPTFGTVVDLPVEPVQAIELFARAAARYFAEGLAADAGALVRKALRLMPPVGASDSPDDPWQPARERFREVSRTEGSEAAEERRRMWATVSVVRKGGFLAGATDLAERLEAAWRDEGVEQVDPSALAHARFELALCLRDRGRPEKPNSSVESDGQRASTLFRSAGELWDEQADARPDEATEPRWWATSARMMTGVAELDRAEFRAALRTLERVVDERRRQLEAASASLDGADEKPRAHEGLGRGLYALSRGYWYLGQLKEASAAAAEAAAEWTKARGDGPLIYRASANANRAVVDAMLGDAEAAGRAEEAWSDATNARGENHPDSALVKLAYADVLRLTGDGIKAHELASGAMRVIGRYWSPTHPIFLKVERSMAEANLAMGRLDDALAGTIRILSSAPAEIHRTRPGERPGAVRAWLVAGLTLLRDVPHVRLAEVHESTGGVELRADRANIERADQCLRVALQHLELWTAPGEGAGSDVGRGSEVPPEEVWARLARLEIALRRGPSGDEAKALVDVGEALVERASLVSATWPSVLVAQIRTLRARLAADEAPDRLLGELRALMAGDEWTQRLLRPADRVDAAVAWCEIARDVALDVSMDERAEIHAEARRIMHRAWVGLPDPENEPTPPHPLRAYGYSALALLANTLGGRQRARNERERDANRAGLNPEIVSQLLRLLKEAVNTRESAGVSDAV